ncbi:Uncharacterised protein [Yersinia rohdei]|uniref:hypothetical protein n=1 Tax=Yersinia rohdei TaxID=29485 RepID=UPI0005EA48A9|nr:hypothetical protein [Yersinia rohdei]CNI84319.1 Uncharacterised protein [Yersinia rohdei]
MEQLAKSPLAKDTKYYVIWEDRKIGYFLNDTYYGKNGFPEGHLEGNKFVSNIENSSAPEANQYGIITEKSLVRGDGTEFKLIPEDHSDVTLTSAHRG